jgi:hypothetical protein
LITWLIGRRRKGVTTEEDDGGTTPSWLDVFLSWFLS